MLKQTIQSDHVEGTMNFNICTGYFRPIKNRVEHSQGLKWLANPWDNARPLVSSKEGNTRHCINPNYPFHKASYVIHAAHMKDFHKTTVLKRVSFVGCHGHLKKRRVVNSHFSIHFLEPHSSFIVRHGHVWITQATHFECIWCILNYTRFAYRHFVPRLLRLSCKLSKCSKKGKFSHFWVSEVPEIRILDTFCGYHCFPTHMLSPER